MHFLLRWNTHTEKANKSQSIAAWIFPRDVEPECLPQAHLPPLSAEGSWPFPRTADNLTKIQSTPWSSTRSGRSKTPPSCERQEGYTAQLSGHIFSSVFRFGMLPAYFLAPSLVFPSTVWSFINYIISPVFCNFFECVACVVIHSEGPLFQKKFPRGIFRPLHIIFIYHCRE